MESEKKDQKGLLIAMFTTAQSAKNLDKFSCQANTVGCVIQNAQRKENGEAK